MTFSRLSSTSAPRAGSIASTAELFGRAGSITTTSPLHGLTRKLPALAFAEELPCLGTGRSRSSDRYSGCRVQSDPKDKNENDIVIGGGPVGLRLDDEPPRALRHDRQRAIGAGADAKSVPLQVQDDGAGPDNGLSLR